LINWVSPKIVSRKIGRPYFGHDMTRETQTNLITILNTFSKIILSRRPIFLRVVLSVFLDEPNFNSSLKKEGNFGQKKEMTYVKINCTIKVITI
jgi:hypothetical protein